MNANAHKPDSSVESSIVIAARDQRDSAMLHRAAVAL